MSKAPKATEARDSMLSELLICIQAAPEGDRSKLFTSIKSFLGEHTERKTSLSRFMTSLTAPPAPPDEKETAEKEVVAAKPPKAAPKAPGKAKKKKG